MLRFSSRCTGPFRIFTLTSLRCLAAGKRGTHSRHYLQALLVQSGERRNAENLSETVPASARVMQRFLAESPWDDDTVIGRLQEYLGTPAWTSGCGVGAGRQRLPEAGQEVRGSGPSVLRETGQGGQLPGRNVPGLRQPAGPGPGGQTALFPGVKGGVKVDPGTRFRSLRAIWSWLYWVRRWTKLTIVIIAPAGCLAALK